VCHTKHTQVVSFLWSNPQPGVVIGHSRERRPLSPLPTVRKCVGLGRPSIPCTREELDTAEEEGGGAPAREGRMAAAVHHPGTCGSVGQRREWDGMSDAAQEDGPRWQGKAVCRCLSIQNKSGGKRKVCLGAGTSDGPQRKKDKTKTGTLPSTSSLHPSTINRCTPMRCVLHRAGRLRNCSPA